MRKKVTKRQWYDDELVDGEAKSPVISTSEEGHLLGLNEGEIHINNSINCTLWN